MDPNANIERQREIAREIAERDSTLEVREDGNKTWSLADLADELAELVLALDEWRQKGGYDPYTAPGEGECTGWFDRANGMIQHDGDTCPIHEQEN